MYTPTKSSVLKIDDKTQRKIHYYMPNDAQLRELADFFSTFSDSTRIKIISALSISELCVNDIANLLKLNQTTVSHQLKLLKTNGAVKFRRDGKVIYYSINDKAINDCLLNAVNFIAQN